MNGKYLLDTNIIIALFNDDKKVVTKLLKLKEVCLSNIVIGELYYGSYTSSKKKSNEKRIEDLISSMAIIDNDKHTAKIYGRIKSELKKKGKPIPENDIWLAAVALQYKLTLVTRDKHFKYIDNLLFEMWN